MAQKHLKTRTSTCTTLRNDIFLSINRYSKETQIPVSRLLDMAIEKYLKEKGVEIHE